MLELKKGDIALFFIEAWALGLFMVSATICTIVVEHPDFWVRQNIAHDLVRRTLIGFAMGITAVYIIKSSWGQKSGAHMNPAFTLSFWAMKKISMQKAIGYILFQFIGSYLGVLICKILFPNLITHPSVLYIVTVPANIPNGTSIAFILEALLSFILMITVLLAGRSKKIMSYIPWFVCGLLTVFIAFEAPYSGMSINPARTLGSTLNANIWTALWLYFVAPPLGMLGGVVVYKAITFSKKSLV